MKIEIIGIGSEIIAGNIVNTNASYLSKELSKKGFCVVRHCVLPDDREIMEEGIALAWKRNDIVLITGGLGPTCDDLTREILAKFFHSKFVYSEEVAADLQKRFGNKLSSLQDQATVIEKARILPNLVGTAPGFLFEEEGKILASLPGVPIEMKKMFLEFVLPALEKKYPKREKKAECTFHVCLLTENDIDPFLRKMQQEHPEVESGIYPSTGVLGVHFASTNEQSLERVKKGFLTHFSQYTFSQASEKLEEVLQKEMIKQGQTLALAESCTGGAVSAHITSIAGASEYFLGSLVTYSNSWKQQFLDVRPETITETGAVSKETVEEMLNGLLKGTKADYVAAVSGIAGPLGGTKEKPVGSVWIGICKRGEAPTIMHFQFPATREVVIACSVNYILGGLWRKVVFSLPPFERE